MTAIREFFSQLMPFVGELEKDKEKEIIIRVEMKQKPRKEDLEELSNLLRNLTKTETKQSVVKLPGKVIKTVLYPYPPGIHRELLNRSILMCLVSYFEVLVSDLAHLYYRLFPDALPGEEKDKVLSINELRQFSSVDDALQFVVSRRVEKMLRDGIDEWHKFFSSRMNIDLDELVPDVAQWKEFFLRRHIMVHAGGRATEHYLDSVDWDRLGPTYARPSVGDKLDIDDSYLERAVDAFEVAGLLLCQEAWKKLAPNETEVRLGQFMGLCDAVYRRLRSPNWYVAERLAEWGTQDSDAPEDRMLVCKFNTWLCIKRQGRWEEVAKEVEAFDTSAKHPQFSLVKASLLEQADHFFRLLPAAMGAGVKVEDLKEWPILEEMRADPRFEEFIKGTE